MYAVLVAVAVFFSTVLIGREVSNIGNVFTGLKLVIFNLICYNLILKLIFQIVSTWLLNRGVHAKKTTINKKQDSL
jgi:hypothetical protein